MDEIFQDRGRTWKARARDLLKQRFPILRWLPKYQKSYLLSDMVAGLTVWLTAVPQSLAYAGIAGLSPEYGLYSQFMGPFLYIFMGSCRQMTVGPTAIVQLFTYQKCGDDFPECVVLMSFWSGVVMIVLGILQLGFLVSFISEPVTIGFTAGAVGVIAAGQLKALLGISGVQEGSGFVDYMSHLIEHYDTIKLGDSCLGITCIFVLLILKKIKELPVDSKAVKHSKVLASSFYVLGLTRNALVVFVSSLVAFLWVDAPFALTGSVRKGFPPIGVPSFQLPRERLLNTTLPPVNQYMGFTETMSFLGTSPLVVAFGAILQNIAISKAFSAGQAIDPSQEMLATGVINSAGAFFSSIPNSGSLARSAINDASGVKSPLGGFFTGSMILLSLGYLTPFFVYIPKASLAAIIICAVIFLIEVDSIKLMYATSKLDFLCCMITIVASLGFGVQFGMLIGVAVSLSILLLRSLRPSMIPEFKIDPETNVHFVLLKPDQGINFPSVDYIRDSVYRIAKRHDNYSVIVVQCDKWTKWDFTAANALVYLTKAMSKRGIHMIFYKCGPEWYNLLETFGLKDPPCCYHKEDLVDYFKHINSNDSDLSSSGTYNEAAVDYSYSFAGRKPNEKDFLLDSSRSFPNYMSL